MSEKNIAIIEIIICSVLWSIAGVMIKSIQCHPMVIAGIRSLVATITLWCVYKDIRQKKNA